MRIAMFGDAKFVTDGAGGYYTPSNIRRAMLDPLVEQCDGLTMVFRLREGELPDVPASEVIRHPKIEFLGVPYFRGIFGSYLSRRTIRAQARRAIENADVCFLRYGGNVSCTAQPLARRLGKPCIGHVIGEFDREIRDNPKHVPVPVLRGWVARWQLARNRGSYRACDAYCGVTKVIAAQYAPPGAEVHQVVDTCLAPACYSPPRRAAGKPLRAIWAGRVLEFKNPQAFLWATARLRSEGIELQPVIVGDGPFLPRLKAIAAEAGLEGLVEFTGRVESRQKLWELYRSADIGFMLSLSEGLPLGVIELMSVGLPILGARLDYMQAVMTDGVEGLLADPNDLDDITEKLRMLATDPERRYALGRAAYERAQSWSAESQARRLIELASRLVAERAARR